MRTVQPPVRRLQMASGRRFRILAIFDDCTRECLAAVADISLSDRRVARELDLLIARRGRPGTIVSDNRAELTNNAILGWAKQTEWDGTTSRQGSLCRRLRRELQWAFAGPGAVQFRLASSFVSSAKVGRECPGSTATTDN
jgi:transposase InsO family protein